MNQRTTLVLLGVFSLLMGYLLYTRRNPAPAPTPEPGSNRLLWEGLQSADIIGFKLNDHETGQTVELRKDDQGLWTVTSSGGSVPSLPVGTPTAVSTSEATAQATEVATTLPNGEPVTRPADANRAASAASQLAGLSVLRTITENTDLGAYGLLDPHYTFEVSKAGGETLVIDVGKETPVGNGHYALRRGETNPVVVNSFTVNALTPLISAPPYQPTPTPEATATVGSPVPEVTETTEPQATPTGP